MSNPMIDVASLAKLKDMIGGDSEDLAELVDDFVTAFPAQAETMQTLASEENWTALRIDAHSCKSNARDLGATALSELCAKLELDCKGGAPSDAAAQVQEIQSQGMQALSALREIDLTNV
ncbi:MAG: Hpt domain-containing protein [Pseudomonadota bacterium]